MLAVLLPTETGLNITLNVCVPLGVIIQGKPVATGVNSVGFVVDIVLIAKLPPPMFVMVNVREAVEPPITLPKSCDGGYMLKTGGGVTTAVPDKGTVAGEPAAL
jgi:hypothetical protein